MSDVVGQSDDGKKSATNIERTYLHDGVKAAEDALRQDFLRSAGDPNAKVKLEEELTKLTGDDKDKHVLGAIASKLFEDKTGGGLTKDKLDAIAKKTDTPENQFNARMAEVLKSQFPEIAHSGLLFWRDGGIDKDDIQSRNDKLETNRQNAVAAQRAADELLGNNGALFNKVAGKDGGIELSSLTKKLSEDSKAALDGKPRLFTDDEAKTVKWMADNWQKQGIDQLKNTEDYYPSYSEFSMGSMGPLYGKITKDTLTAAVKNGGFADLPAQDAAPAQADASGGLVSQRAQLEASIDQQPPNVEPPVVASVVGGDKPAAKDTPASPAAPAQAAPEQAAPASAATVDGQPPATATTRSIGTPEKAPEAPATPPPAVVETAPEKAPEAPATPPPAVVETAPEKAPEAPATPPPAVVETAPEKAPEAPATPPPAVVETAPEKAPEAPATPPPAVVETAPEKAPEAPATPPPAVVETAPEKAPETPATPPPAVVETAPEKAPEAPATPPPAVVETAPEKAPEAPATPPPAVVETTPGQPPVPGADAPPEKSLTGDPNLAKPQAPDATAPTFGAPGARDLAGGYSGDRHNTDSSTPPGAPGPATDTVAGDRVKPAATDKPALPKEVTIKKGMGYWDAAAQMLGFTDDKMSLKEQRHHVNKDLNGTQRAQIYQLMERMRKANNDDFRSSKLRPGQTLKSPLISDS